MTTDTNHSQQSSTTTGERSSGRCAAGDRATNAGTWSSLSRYLWLLLVSLASSFPSSSHAASMLVWDGSPTATDYRVWQSMGTGPFSILNVTIMNSLQVEFPTNVVSRYYVTARNQGGESSPSNTVTNTPSVLPGVLAFSRPQLSATTVGFGLSITGTATITNGTGAPYPLGDAWLVAVPPGATPATGPYFEAVPHVGAQTIAVNGVLVVPGTWTAPSNGPAGTWQMYLAGKNSGGAWLPDGPTTIFNVVSTNVPPAPPPPPTNLRVTQVAPRRRDFSWLSDVDASSVVELAIESDPFKQVAVLSPGNMHWTDSKARSKPTRYRVKSCKVLCSAWSEITWRP